MILSRDDLGAQFEGTASILFLPGKVIRVGQHFGYFQLAGFAEPAVENFEEKITLQIDVNGLRIFVAAFGGAAAKRRLGRPM